MSPKADKAAAPDERALHALIRMIAARDGGEASRLLAESPALARCVVRIGATRQDPHTYYFKEIGHYAYLGDTPLHMAAAAYERALAEELLSKGADVRAKNRRGAEPLHYAADGAPGSSWWSPEAQQAVVELLIASGADPNSEDKSGVAPLHRAVRTRCTAAVRALLSNGADVRRKNKSGSTPLHLAVQDTGRGGSGAAGAREEQMKVIRLLLGHGARPSDRDAAGKSVQQCARAEWIQEILGTR
jgi:Ankyrin repeats (3 copies)/Ankyrin repeat